jgi:N-acetylneuraminic acid mutarotase
MPRAQSCVTATLLTGGLVLVAGGYASSGLLTSATEFYDPVAAGWTEVPGLGTPRAEHTATALPDGRLLVTGGAVSPRSGSGVARSVEIYDPLSQTWSYASDMLVARMGHTATLLLNGQVLVTGGSTDGPPTPTTEIYDPSSNTWTAGPSMSVARSGHTATLLQSGAVLVAGSEAAGVVPAAASAEEYDPAANTWTVVGSMTTARGDQTATELANGKVLVVGGYNSSQLNSAELFDPTTATWAVTASMTTARTGHTAVLVGSAVIVCGGQDTTGNPTASCELYR